MVSVNNLVRWSKAVFPLGWHNFQSSDKSVNNNSARWSKAVFTIVWQNFQSNDQGVNNNLVTRPKAVFPIVWTNFWTINQGININLARWSEVLKKHFKEFWSIDKNHKNSFDQKFRSSEIRSYNHESPTQISLMSLLNEDVWMMKKRFFRMDRLNLFA